MMRKHLMLCLGLLCWLGSGTALAAGNTFNPYMQSRLPAQTLQQGDKDIIAALGGKNMSMQDEASHRPHWREEMYPVVFGNRMGNNEILVLIDYANPQSARVWQEVTRAVPQLNPQTTKIVVFGKSGEKYGTELMGAGIWVTYTRPDQGMNFFSFSLNRWNEVKQGQARQGRAKVFHYEYDATLTPQDYPIINTFVQKLRPAVSEAAERELLRYCYDAGNVNLYQAVSIASYYKIGAFPAVLVNGSVLPNPTATAIVQAMK